MTQSERKLRAAWGSFCTALLEYEYTLGRKVCFMLPGADVYDDAELSAAMDHGEPPTPLISLLTPPGLHLDGGDP